MRAKERKKIAFSFKSEAQRYIRQIRRDLGLTQKGLASKMSSDCDQSTISSWESGKNDIPLSRFVDIMIIAGKDPRVLFEKCEAEKDKTEEVSEVKNEHL